MTNDWLTNINGARILNTLLSAPIKSSHREFNRETGEYITKQFDSIILVVEDEKV